MSFFFVSVRVTSCVMEGSTPHMRNVQLLICI